MDCWSVLGIEKTTDKGLIKKAYYAKLPHYHPEDDPEGFQNLKAAYDTALAAEETESQEEDTTDLGIWIRKVGAVYEDFFRRIDPACWEELLDDPVVVSLATNLEARDRLLCFLCENYRLPQKVFALLGSVFELKENHKELAESFSGNFIDYLLDQAENEGLRYELFVNEPGKDFSRFVENYFTLYYHLIAPLELDKVPGLINETDAMGIAHPDYMLQKIKYLLFDESEDKLDQCLELRDALLVDYPDKRTYYAAAHISYRQEKYDETITWLEQCLAMGGSEYTYSARMLLADCLTGKELYDEALAKYEELRLEAPASDELFHRIRYMHIQLAEKLKPVLSDDETKLKYISHCVAADNYDCEEIAASIDPSQVNRLEYCKNMGAVYGGLKKLDQAVPYFEEALGEVRHSPVSGQSDTSPKPGKQDFCELLSDYGWAYVDSDQFIKAIELFDMAIETDPTYVRGYNRKAYALNKLERYREALVCCDVVLERAPYISAMLSKARALLGLNDYTGALAVVDEAITISLYQEAFRIKLECLYELGRYDEAISLVEFLKDKDSMSVEMMEIHLSTLVRLDKDEESNRIINEILEQDPGNFAALVQRCRVHYQKGDFAQAEAALDQISPQKASRQAIAYAYSTLFTMAKRYDLANQRLLGLLEPAPESASGPESSESGPESSESAPGARSQAVPDGVKEDVYLRLAQLAEEENEHLQEEFGHTNKELIAVAIEYYQEVLKVNPAHPFANRSLSARYFEREDYEESLIFVKRQVGMSKKNKDEFLYGDYMNLALTYSRLGKGDEEKQAINEALTLSPYDESLNNYMGAWYVEHNEHTKAYPFFITALTYGNNDINFWRNITQNLCVLEKYEEGISVATKAVAAYPDAEYFRYREAWFYQLAGRYKEAIPLFENWGNNVSDVDFKQEALVKVGDCRACMNDYPGALEAYRKALAVKRKNRTLGLKIGMIYKLMNQERNARKAYRKALFSKRCDDALHRLAMLAWQGGHKIRSRLLTKGLAFYLFRKREDGDFFLLGQMYKAQGKYEQAITCFNKKIAKTLFCHAVCKSGCSESYYELAEIYRILGNEEEARLCTEKAEGIARGRFGCGEGEFFS
ncbi:MAG: tetratricopeptide repeat protein [Peptococcaceae bacterium]|nr:tetratricopeptide repeat protein [Peptococcaceae bacterium]